MKFYTGIGARKTPNEILRLMEQMSRHLAKHQYTLRSGGANGADLAFEKGCDRVNGQKEIFIPWKSFNNSNSSYVLSSKEAFILAEKFHPYWHNLSEGAKKLQARNVHQILGNNLNTCSDFVICYTEGGKGKGGTGQAIRIANHYKIPIFDCGLYEDNIEELKNQYKLFLKKVYIK